MRILIAPNSFKGCDNSINIAETIQTELVKIADESKNPEFGIKLSSEPCFQKFPLTDGGDGFLDVLAQKFQLDLIKFRIKDPTQTKLINIDVGYLPEEKTVFIESAKIIGLNIIKTSERDPKNLTSAGLGELLNLLIKSDLSIKNVIIGLGGSATNDLGLGALSELGIDFLDENAKVVNPIPANFKKISAIPKKKINLPFNLQFYLDVENPLTGKKGAAQIFGPQKGLKDSEIVELDEEFERIISLFGKNNSANLSGAAGGICAGFQMTSKIEKKFTSDLFDDLGINSLNSPDLIITGEGEFDEQTFMGKAPKILIDKFPLAKTAVITGKFKSFNFDEDRIKIYELNKYFNSPDDSIKNYKLGIKFVCKEICKDFLFKAKDN